jgi:hypothetical protein
MRYMILFEVESDRPSGEVAESVHAALYRAGIEASGVDAVDPSRVSLKRARPPAGELDDDPVWGKVKPGPRVKIKGRPIRP